MIGNFLIFTTFIVACLGIFHIKLDKAIIARHKAFTYAYASYGANSARRYYLLHSKCIEEMLADPFMWSYKQMYPKFYNKEL